MPKIQGTPWLAAALAILLSACASTQDSPRPGEGGLSPAQIHVQSAEELLRNGNPELALRKVLQALDLDPNLSSAYDVAARIYEQSSQPALAQKYYLRAVQLAPQDVRTRLNYGRFLCTQNQAAVGQEELLEAAKYAEGRARAVAYVNAGLCAQRVPDLDGAAQYFRAALETQPDMAVAYYQLARINYDKGRYPQAKRYIQSYFSLGEPAPKALLLGMHIAQAQGDRESLDRYADYLRTRYPDSEQTRQGERLLLQPLPDRPPMLDLTALTASSAPPGSAAPVLDKQWILSRPPGHNTIQLLRSHSPQALNPPPPSLRGLAPLAYYSANQGGITWYTLLYGDYATRTAAETAYGRLPPRWRDAGAVIRPFASIQRSLIAPP